MEQSGWFTSDQPVERPVQVSTDTSAEGTAPPSKIVVLASRPNGASTARGSVAEPTSGKWPRVLERVRSAAQYIRQVEDRAQDYELRVQELLEQVRADMRDADAKVRAAEQRTREVQAQAEASVRSAQAQARAAEERAVAAEEWLRLISEAVETEFAVEPAAPRMTGTRNT